MEAYLEALDVGILRADSQGFPKPRDATNLQGDEVHYEKWDAKARKNLFRGLCKDAFNHVRNHKDAHSLGQTFVRSMREQRASVSNAIILS